MTPRYGTKVHDDLRDYLRELFWLSHRYMSRYYDAWTRAENLYRAFLPTTQEDSRRKSKMDLEGVPQYTTIHIPYSYATLLTAHTYWASVFLGRTPVFQFTGRHGATQQAIQAIEAVIDYQVHVGRILAPLYVWLLDTGKYGVGIIGLRWTKESYPVTKLVVRPKRLRLGDRYVEIPGTEEKVLETVTIDGYEGHQVFNVRPFDFFPDPRVPLANFQDGDFVGRLATVTWTRLLELQDEYDNLDVLQDHYSHGRINRITGSTQVDVPGTASEEPDPKGRSPIELFEVQVKLVPKDWGLGDGTRPEKWAFTLAGDDVLIEARPLGLDHNKFTYAICLYEPSDHGRLGRGLLEVSETLNQAMTWLVNSHMFNVRQVLNGQLVVDPQRVVMQDLKDGGPGRIIRLSPMAYGQDVRTVVSQLPVADVTQTHIADLKMFIELVARVTGVSDNLFGALHYGGRKSATEVRLASISGVNRLRTFTEYNSALGWEPLAQMMVQTTQQLYSGERVYRIAGDLTAYSARYVKVSPEDIAGAFDFVPVDGTAPIDRLAQANLWKEILIGLAQMPFLAQNYDLAGIFAWMAQMAGLKNISQFRIQPQPDEQLLRQVEAGNLVEASRASGGTRGTPGEVPGAEALLGAVAGLRGVA